VLTYSSFYLVQFATLLAVKCRGTVAERLHLSWSGKAYDIRQCLLD